MALTSISEKTEKSESPALPAKPPSAPNKPRRLTTFRPPAPSPLLIKALVPVNRWLCLGGIPGLRVLPLLGLIPGIRGLTNIQKIDFPSSDVVRLSQAVRPGTAAFITPNHPEFFTDWMLDKEVLTRVSPMAASWATHEVVNGLGPLAQAFWLKNNLIAQIPGAGGQAGKDHSIAWALKGYGVLLHPEGSVGWHGDLIGPLFPGAAQMALDAAARIAEAGEARPVFIAPVVWKLEFMRDVSKALHRELGYVEKALQLPSSAPGCALAMRLYKAYDGLLARDEIKWGVHPTSAPYFERQQGLVAKLATLLEARLDRLGAPAARVNNFDERIRRGERWLRGVDKTAKDGKDLRALVKDLRRLGRIRGDLYREPSLNQEQIAESIKRIRNDYCTGSFRDMLNKYLPQPAGPRIAHIRVPEPIEIGALAGATAGELVVKLRSRMQACLDTINREAVGAGYGKALPNPFLLPDEN